MSRHTESNTASDAMAILRELKRPGRLSPSIAADAAVWPRAVIGATKIATQRTRLRIRSILSIIPCRSDRRERTPVCDAQGLQRTVVAQPVGRSSFRVE